MMEEHKTDALTGTVKGPGERPHEYLFITADHVRARIGEFVYYEARAMECVTAEEADNHHVTASRP